MAAAKAAGIGIPGLKKEHVLVPRIAQRMAQVRQSLEDGYGFALIRGLEGERYRKADAALIYWIMGTQLGKSYAQNAHGDMLGHVRDLGADFKTHAKRARLPDPDVSAVSCGLDRYRRPAVPEQIEIGRRFAHRQFDGDL